MAATTGPRYANRCARTQLPAVAVYLGESVLPDHIRRLSDHTARIKRRLPSAHGEEPHMAAPERFRNGERKTILAGATRDVGERQTLTLTRRELAYVGCDAGG